MRLHNFLLGILSMVVVGAITFYAGTASSEDLTIDFRFPDKADGYTLYMDGKEYCKITEIEAGDNAVPGETPLTMLCDPGEIDPGWHSFTMTADIPEYSWSSAHESGHSPPVVYYKKYAGMNSTPTVITITIDNGSGQPIIIKSQ